MNASAPKLTALILTYNRYSRLTRLLKYIDRLRPAFPIVVLDSSSEKFDYTPLQPLLERNGIAVRRFDRSIHPIEKSLRGLEEVRTPYAVLWADDDFMVPGALEDCVRFLETRPNFAAAHGEAGIFSLGKTGADFSADSFSHYPLGEILADTASGRLTEHLSCYSVLFHSVHRTEVLKESFGVCLKHNFGYNFDEIVTGSWAAVCGKVARLKRLYMLRERHANANSWNNVGWKDYFDFVTSPIFSVDYGRMRDVLGEFIAAREGMEPEEAKRIVDKGFHRYLAEAMARQWRSRFSSHSPIRRRLRRFRRFHALWMNLRAAGFGGKNRFLLPALKRKNSPYHADFAPVFNTLQNG